MALIAGFAGVLFGAVLVRRPGALGLRFKTPSLGHWLGSSAVRKRTALRRSLAESGTSLRLVPCPASALFEFRVGVRWLHDS